MRFKIFVGGAALGLLLAPPVAQAATTAGEELHTTATVTVTEFSDSTFTSPTSVTTYDGRGKVVEPVGRYGGDAATDKQPGRPGQPTTPTPTQPTPTQPTSPTPPAPTAQPEQLTVSGVITVTEFGAKGFAGTPVGVATYSGEGTLLSRWGRVKGGFRAPHGAAKTGPISGGTPSASGCHRVEVENTAHNLLGSTAYTLHTWTDTCWNRAAGTTRATTNDYSLSADSQHQWAAGWLIFDGLYYDYGPNNRQPNSAFRFRAQKRIDNCLLKIGCVASHYPINIIRTYKDGTFQAEWDD
jgi:hypothetical protein